jgi:transcriptional regulator with XRE-family HTH domain
LGWSQDQLSVASKVAKATIANFEAGKRAPYERTLADIRESLEKAGVNFIAQNGGGAGVRLAKPD